MSYAEQKEAIDDDPSHVRMSTAGRKEILAGSMYETRVADYAPVEGANVKEEQDAIQEQFAASLQVTGFDQYRYKQIDQGNDGACTVMALFHLIHLNDLDGEIHGRPWSGVKKPSYWKTSYWNPISRKCWQIFQSVFPRFFADTLDIGLMLKKPAIVRLCNHPDFRYVPVRGDAARESYTNALFFTEEAREGTLMRYGKDVVQNNPVTCAIGHFVESLLDRGVVVGVSWNAHARVIVAHNDSHLLFADSWDNGVMYEEQNEDYYVAGVSIVPKFKVYMYCRDFVYFEKSKGESKSVAEEKQASVESAAAARPRRRSTRRRMSAEPFRRPLRTDYTLRW